MTPIYRLRMLSDENDNFLREYEVAGDSTLLDLHDLISADLGYDPEGIVSFFASDEQWNKLAEFTLVDMGEGGPVPMQDVTVAQVLNFPQARLVYLFDLFNDRAMFIESFGSFDAKAGVEYPVVSISEAYAPDQHEPSGDQHGSKSIFDEAMGEFGSFEGEEYYDDEF